MPDDIEDHITEDGGEYVEPCPACAEKRLHGAAEWRYHPDAGKGQSKQ